jgi:hypothetical protein
MVIDLSIVGKAAEPPGQRSPLLRRDLRSVPRLRTPATRKQVLRRATRTDPLLAKEGNWPIE